MIPFFEQPSWHLGPLTIHAFGVAVSLGLWAALTMLERRLAVASLDPVIVHRLGGWMLAAGIVGAHLFSVILYFPEDLRTDPWLLLRVWDDVSSFGGMIGGLVGALLFFRLRAAHLGSRIRLAYLDAIASVFPVGLAVGRLGCALAHDHPGVVTTSPLAISLESPTAQAYIRGVYAAAGRALPSDIRAMGFHDLGVYEFTFLLLVVVPAFIYWLRKQREPGFYLVAFAMLYLPVRFALDTLRVADARYLWLTPAQWIAAATLAVLPLLVLDHRKVRFVISGAVILATACACWGGAR